MKLIKGRPAFYIAAALLAAFVVWLFVDSANATKVSIDVTGIPVEFIGEETTLAGRGLMRIRDAEEPTLDLRIQGRRTDIARLDPDELRVQVDLFSVTETGLQNLQWKPIYPDSRSAKRLTIESSSSSYVSVNIGELFRKSVEIKVDVYGTVADGYLAGKVETEPKTLELWGKESEVTQVDYAKVKLDIDNATSTVTQDVAYQLYDANDRLIENSNIHAMSDTIKARLPVNMSKVLPLVLNFEESPGSRLSNVEYTISPATVSVVGDASILDAVDSILLGTVDLSALNGTENFRYPIQPPDGCINDSGYKEAAVRVSFKDLTTAAVTTTNLSFENPPAGKTVTILSESLTVTLRGTSVDLADVSGDQLTVLADLSGVANAGGNYTVPAIVSVNAGGDLGVVGSYQIKINISDTPAEPDIPPEDGVDTVE